METKTALLEQLRIDRRETPSQLAGGLGSLDGSAWVRWGRSWWLPAWRSSPSRGREWRCTQRSRRRTRAGGGASGNGGSLLDASGYVVALREATVSAKSIYKVHEVMVQEGQPVKEGGAHGDTR